MALNPEIVADILQIELNRDCVGDWYQNGHAPRVIEQKAMERATSPESFADWLVRQYFFRLRSGVELYDFKTALIEKLATADQTEMSEQAKTITHKILYIESIEQQASSFGSLTKSYAKHHYGIPASRIKFKHLAYPPGKASSFVSLLHEHTGAVLHNLSLGDLSTIRDAVRETQSLSQKLVVVKTGGSTTSDHEQLYDELKAQGVMVIMKPFPSIEEVVRVILGVV